MNSGLGRQRGVFPLGHGTRDAVRMGLLAQLAVCCLVASALCGCAALGPRPSNARSWSPDQALLSRAEINGDIAHVYNIRDCTYLDQDTYVLNHYDKTYDLSRLQTVDFFVVPFRDTPSLAHTMLSFGFEDGEHLAVSVEIRREQGEKYDVLKSMLNQYELMYVVADERDVVKLRTNYRGDDVYLYRGRATPDQARMLFLDVMNRVNKLAASPEFYNVFINNCTTNVIHHINHVAPGKVPYKPYSPKILLTGHSDRLAYDLGLLDTKLPFEEARRRAQVSPLARQFATAPDFSQRIRR
jgi:hypothetical protein